MRGGMIKKKEISELNLTVYGLRRMQEYDTYRSSEVTYTNKLVSYCFEAELGKTLPCARPA